VTELNCNHNHALLWHSHLESANTGHILLQSGEIVKCAGVV
jgi:hypothetical protein